MPETIRALCLNQQALAVVKRANPVDTLLRSLVSTEQKHIDMLDTSAISTLATSLDELFRHYSDLAKPGMESIVSILRGLTLDEVKCKRWMCCDEVRCRQLKGMGRCMNKQRPMSPGFWMAC